MAGAINAIIAAVAALLPVGITAGDSGDDSAVEDAAGRVVWVPMGIRYRPPRGQGGSTVRTAQHGSQLPAGTWQPIYTRVQEMEARCWGVDRDAAEELHDQVITAVHMATAGSSRPTQAVWLEPESSLKSGEEIRITFEFEIPVQRAAEKLRTITTMPITPVVQPAGA